jgi:hypothetical protein
MHLKNLHLVKKYFAATFHILSELFGKIKLADF